MEIIGKIHFQKSKIIHIIKIKIQNHIISIGIENKLNVQSKITLSKRKIKSFEEKNKNLDNSKACGFSTIVFVLTVMPLNLIALKGSHKKNFSRNFLYSQILLTLVEMTFIVSSVRGVDHFHEHFFQDDQLCSLPHDP